MLPLRCPCVYPAALCVFGLTAMPVPPAAIVALPPNLTSTFQQRVPWAVPGVELPQELADMRPIPFEFGEDIKQKERPTYYWAFRIMQNLVRRVEQWWCSREVEKAISLSGRVRCCMQRFASRFQPCWDH